VTNVFVRNLDPATTEAQLKNLFSTYGAVETVTIVHDRDTGQPRGMAFVEMSEAAEAQAAIKSLNGFRLHNHELRLNEARDKLKPEPGHEAASREHRRHRI
jgi:cold-inducible RNA-binding protein